MELPGIEEFKSPYPEITISAESLENYFKLPWNNPKEFQKEFDKKSKEFHEISKRTAKTANDKEREYSNLRAIDVLWKPFDYQVATRTSSDVGVNLQDDLTDPVKIKKLFEEAKLGPEDKPVTAEELLKCKTSQMTQELSKFIKKLIAAQIFFNRISYHSEVQQQQSPATSNALTKITSYSALVKRFFSNLQSHEYSLDIETYYQLKDDDRLISHETFVSFFRLMFSPENLIENDPAIVQVSQSFYNTTPELKLTRLFTDNASVEKVAHLMVNLLKTYESNSTYKGAPYTIDTASELSDIKNFPVPVELKDSGTIDEESGSKSSIASDLKVCVTSKFGHKDNIRTHPLVIEMKNFQGLTNLFQDFLDDLVKEDISISQRVKKQNASKLLAKRLMAGKNADVQQKEVSKVAYWFSLLNQALKYGEALSAPFIMISNMLHSFVMRFPLDELIQGKQEFSRCDLYGPIDLKRTPVSLLVSVMAFQGMIDIRDSAENDRDIVRKLVRFSKLTRNTSFFSYIWTHGVPESSGKKERDIDRQKISMEAFNVCLGLDIKESGDYDEEAVSKLIPEIQKLAEKVEEDVGLYIRKSKIEDKSKKSKKSEEPAVEPVLLESEDFVFKEILKGREWYSRDLASTFVVLPESESDVAILKVFDPVKLNCFKSDKMLFEYVETLANSKFLHNVYSLMSECFLREVKAYLLMEHRLNNYSDYVPKLKSYGFLKNKRFRDMSITNEDFYDHYIIDDSSGINVLNQQGGFILLEKIEDTKDECLGLPEGERIEIARKGIEALEKIHSAGIIHGDIKKDNVIITKSKTGKQYCVKIIDFGHSLKSNTNQSENKKPVRGKKRKIDASDSEDHDNFIKRYEKGELETVLTRMLDLPKGSLKS